jgi:hypothetical protein
MAVQTKIYFLNKFAPGYILTAQDMDDLIDSVAFLTDVDAADSAEAIRDKLQTLVTPNRLAASAIEGLLNQTDAEIATAYGNEVALVTQAEAEAGTSTVVRRWTAQRVKQAIEAIAAGGGASTGQFDLTIGSVTAKGEYIGANAPTVTTGAAGVYAVTIPANTRLISLTISGDNTTLNGANEFVVQMDNSANGLQRSYSCAQYVVSTGASVNPTAIGTNQTETFPSANVSQYLFPGMNGYGATGFRIVIS